MRLIAAAPRALTPLALAAAVLGLLLPSTAVARHSDVLLALLVLVTALGIPTGALRTLASHRGTVIVLAIAPTVALTAAAWLIGRPFGTPVRDGLLAIGLSSAEVATVGLVALAGADAAIALGAVTGSLILAALAGPAAIGRLAGQPTHGGAGHLLGRFALVVLAPLAAGALARRIRPGLSAADPALAGVGALTVAALVYAALGGTAGVSDLGPALLAALLLLGAGGLLGALWRRRMAPGVGAVPGALTIGMRDFAVAAALAQQAFGPRAATVPGVYGVVMLIAGAVAAARLAATARSVRGERADGRG